MMPCTHDEIVSQPDLWCRVAELFTDLLSADGEYTIVAGHGTSWLTAWAYTTYRERAGKDAGDAYTVTELPWGYAFDRIICLSRSGTMTGIIQVMKRLREEGRPALLIIVVTGGPAAEYASEEVVLDFADEISVIQTRLATSALQYFPGSLGHGVRILAADAERTLATEISPRWVDTDQISFLGTEWMIGPAVKAGLKLCKTSQSWTEVYPAVEYRHGPTLVTQPGRLTWVSGPAPDGLAEQVYETGAELATSDGCPVTYLVLVQRLAVECVPIRGLSPDTPRNLTRSVILL